MCMAYGAYQSTDEQGAVQVMSRVQFKPNKIYSGQYIWGCRKLEI